jgi:hypothetical protein
VAVNATRRPHLADIAPIVEGLQQFGSKSFRGSVMRRHPTGRNPPCERISDNGFGELVGCDGKIRATVDFRIPKLAIR